MFLIPPQHLRIVKLRHRLANAHYRYTVALTSLISEQERQTDTLHRRRRWWVRPWLTRRPLYGQYKTLMAELRLEHHGDFKAFLRIDPEMFHELLVRVGPVIEKSVE